MSPAIFQLAQWLQRPGIKPVVKIFVKTFLSGVCLLTVTGFFGGYHWLLDLTSHFRLQCLGVQLLFVPLFVWLRWRPGWLCAMALCALVNLSQIAPFYWPPLPQATQLAPESQPPPNLRLLHANVFRFNPNRQALLHLIDTQKPHLIALAEYDLDWRKATRQSDTLKGYPYQLVDWKSRTALLSQLPFTHTQVVRLQDGYKAILLAQVTWQHQPVAVAVIHPKPPYLPQFHHTQVDCQQTLARLLPTLPPNRLVVGDFNITPWSHRFHQLRNSTHLRDSAQGFGIQPSWPLHSPLVMLPLDHALVGGALRVVNRTPGPTIGSDHRPLLLEMAIGPAPAHRL